MDYVLANFTEDEIETISKNADMLTDLVLQQVEQLGQKTAT